MSLFDDSLKLAGTAVLRNPVLAGETVTISGVEYDVCLNPLVSDKQIVYDRVNSEGEPMACVEFANTITKPTEGAIITRSNGQLLRIQTVNQLDFCWRCYCRIK
jgi:hypothetical protein